jgi:hypothetical protein
MNKLNNWIEFIFGFITAIYIYYMYGGHNWKFWVTIIFISILSTSYHEIKKHLESKE